MFESIKQKFWAVVGPVGSIIEARLTALTGLITGALGFIDWSPLLTLFGAETAFNKTQVIAIGAVLFVKGIIQEIVRRTNDPLLTATQAVEAAPEVAKAKKALKKVVAKTPPVGK